MFLMPFKKIIKERLKGEANENITITRNIAMKMQHSPFFKKSPPPLYILKPQDALRKCVAFTNYNIETNVGFGFTFMQKAYRLYVAHVELHNAYIAAGLHCANMTSVDTKPVKPATFDEFASHFGRRAHRDYRIYSGKIKRHEL